jgi:hypothetical protein
MYKEDKFPAEFPDGIPDSQLANQPDLDVWGNDAATLLQAVTAGIHYVKKRRTLIALADAAYNNTSQANVFRDKQFASKVAHYKWRANDPDYETAYLYLVGDLSDPGVARISREQELDEDEHVAISALAEARTKLRIASAEAVDTLVDALGATNRFDNPMWHQRILAASAILDRADAETAARSAPALMAVDKAIMTIYSDTTPSIHNQQSGLQDDPPPNQEGTPPVDDDGNVIVVNTSEYEEHLNGSGALAELMASQVTADDDDDDQPTGPPAD